ncbi:hypothetical protein GCM10017781_38540 [Deinococcus metalli]|uniref:JAB domain-containing protein n=1 Tax=Deinococcus metalli TaxID=1141878 RepID=A0ABQ3JW34_9DEIO|nr:hypothetical protein GCM10017781_38540 [Deinococcus metalli]
MLLQAVTHTLHQQLLSPTRIRGGLLFGYQEQHTLHVLLASTAGAPTWYPDTPRDVLQIDPRFTVGWSEALATLWPGRVDWIGNWIIHPDSQSAAAKHDHRLVRQGHTLGVLDDRSILLIPSWNEGVLEFRSYTLDQEGQAEELPCRVGPRSPLEVMQTLSTARDARMESSPEH